MALSHRTDRSEPFFHENGGEDREAARASRAPLATLLLLLRPDLVLGLAQDPNLIKTGATLSMNDQMCLFGCLYAGS